MNKKHLTILICILGVIGIISLGSVFTGSLAPSAKAEANRPHLNISKIQNGTFKIIEDQPMTYLVIKDHNSKLYVYWLPVTNEGTLLPDVHWGRYGGYCQNFGPEMNGDFIKKDGVITCHDSKELTEAFMWSYDGKNIGSYSHNKNMPIAKYTIDGEYLVLGKL